VPYTLSEHESKRLLAQFGIPVPDERLVDSAEAAAHAADELGLPVVLKLCGRGIAHKTERGLVRLDLRDADAVRGAARELLAARRRDESDARLLVAPQRRGRRELIAGLVRDPQFGPCVMLGLGGIFAEALRDVAFAVAPLERGDADELIDALAAGALLGPFRGEPAVDRARLRAVLEGLARLGDARPDVRSVDVNPLLVDGSEPVVVDALVELEDAL
jgi:acetyl-CoA synthetase (ADP-forming)